MKQLRKLWKEVTGQDLVEYALLLALVALVVAAAFPPITTAIRGVFTNAASTLSTPATN